jgi:(2Fe-2S) ferredoxin
MNECDASADPPLYYRQHVFFCINERPAGHPQGSCKTKGSDLLRNHMQRRARELGLAALRINNSGCLDRCELGPCLVVYPEGVWYSPKTAGDVEEILAVHLAAAGRVPRLLLRPEDGPHRTVPKQRGAKLGMPPEDAA